MPESAALTASFSALRDRADSGIPFSVPGPDDASAAFTDAIGATILPRIVMLAADDGSRVDVMVRNRRVVGVDAVDPADIWQGRIALANAGCDSKPEDFAHPLARAIVTVAGRGSVRVGTRLLDGSAPAIATAGYPAARLSEDIAALRDDAATNAVHAFLDDWSGHALAWSGEDAGTDMPEGCAVDAGWMGQRLSEWSAAAGDDTDLRFVLAEGDAPMALALVAMGGEHCVVACDAPDEFGRLEAALVTLRDTSGGA